MRVPHPLGWGTSGSAGTQHPSDQRLDLSISPQATGSVASNRLLSELAFESEGRSAPWMTMCRLPRFLATSLGTTTLRWYLMRPLLSAVRKRSRLRPLAALVSPVAVSDTSMGP